MSLLQFYCTLDSLQPSMAHLELLPCVICATTMCLWALQQFQIAAALGTLPLCEALRMLAVCQTGTDVLQGMICILTCTV